MKNETLAALCGTLAVHASAVTFGDDAAFLKKYMPVVALGRGAAQVLVAPALQGRVLTSTAAGANGASFGWINRELFASRKTGPHMNAYGGEDRLWLGPEGGQFSVYFAPGVPLDFEHWQVPAAFDTEPFEVSSQDPEQVTLHRALVLQNYSRTTFKLRLERQVRLLTPEQMWAEIGVPAAARLRAVAYESRNRVTNTGDAAWDKATGLLSIWILGMYNAGPAAAVIAPFQTGPEAERGPIVESGYFGTVPPDRLQVRDGYILFRADAQQRGKIGLSPRRAKPVLGSYDAANHVLTIVQFTLPAGQTDYVNSLWQFPQEHPFAGDVANSYNDGPNATGKGMGNFFELESSSPALALKAGATYEHVHRTIHLTGPEPELAALARQVLGADLDEVKKFIAGK